MLKMKIINEKFSSLSSDLTGNQLNSRKRPAGGEGGGRDAQSFDEVETKVHCCTTVPDCSAFHQEGDEGEGSLWARGQTARRRSRGKVTEPTGQWSRQNSRMMTDINQNPEQQGATAGDSPLRTRARPLLRPRQELTGFLFGGRKRNSSGSVSLKPSSCRVSGMLSHGWRGGWMDALAVLD